MVLEMVCNSPSWPGFLKSGASQKTYQKTQGNTRFIAKSQRFMTSSGTKKNQKRLSLRWNYKLRSLSYFEDGFLF